MAMLLSGGGTPEEILRRMQDITGRHSGLTSPKPVPEDNPDASKPNVRFAEATEGSSGVKFAAPAGDQGAETACVTPSQQRQETPQQDTPATDHQDVAMNLEERARKEEGDTGENGDANLKEAFNSPPDAKEAEGGSPV